MSPDLSLQYSLLKIENQSSRRIETSAEPLTQLSGGDMSVDPERDALASAIRIDSLELTIVRLSSNLASVTLDVKKQVEYGKKLAETTTARITELEESNVALLQCVAVQDETVLKLNADLASVKDSDQDKKDELESLEHQLYRHDLISAYLVRSLLSGKTIIKLPRHASHPKAIKATEFQLDMTVHTHEAALNYIDSLYSKLNNFELRSHLRG